MGLHTQGKDAKGRWVPTGYQHDARAYQQVRRATRKQAGLCRECPYEVDAARHVLCRTCRQRKRAKNKSQ